MSANRRGTAWDGLAVLLIISSLLFPPAISPESGARLGWFTSLNAVIAVFILLTSVAIRYRTASATGTPLAALVGILFGAISPLIFLRLAGPGSAAFGLWLYVTGLTVLVWRAMALLTTTPFAELARRVLIAGVFGIAFVWYWQVITVGFGVPSILLPSPTMIWERILRDADLLWGDFRLTFFRAVLTGFTIGSLSGFLFAIVVERYPFLARGLLPLGSAFSAIPIIAVAPIMIIWFGFGSASKAAVITLMTFFPMMVNTLAGLRSVDRMELDLMRSYGADYRTRFFKLILPGALPFIFNALKINSTLAMIGAIVAEFFGTPLAGMGFRISASIGRLQLDMVWATIAVAALSGSLFYGVITLLERRLTFWHPSLRT